MTTNKTFLATTGSDMARAESDANGSWTVEHLLQDQDLRCMTADPLNSHVVYAGTQGNGVLRSGDQGQSWQQAGLPGVIIKSLAVSKCEPGTVYAGTKSPPCIFVSRDSGANWTELEGFRSTRRWYWVSPAESPFSAYVQVIAITRTHLWDIDLVINRTLLVGGMTVSIIFLYGLVVGAAGMLFQTQGNWLIALAATGLVAVLFQPLRERLQRDVNRLVYGQRDEPFEVLTHLGQQLEVTLSPELVYPTIVETVAQTLKLPYAEIAVPDDAEFKTVESYGKPGGDLVPFPLTHQGEVVGQLRVARRALNEDFTEADNRLLRSIAQQAGAAVHAAHLTTALQDSRHHLVTAREEERRRLRRDLHDGLGPQLASQTLGLDAALKLMDHDPQAAKELLQALSSQNQVAVKDIRQLVYGLRPPALDELGLVGALRESTFSYEQKV